MSKNELSTRQKMNLFYKDIEGFKIPTFDSKNVRKSKGSPVYGEINHQALNKLLDYLKLGPKDVFYDLGSGVGKVIIQTALTTRVKLAVGIELSGTRHDSAKQALDRAIEMHPMLKNRVRFLQKDLLTVDLKPATVIYTCSTAFSESFMNKLTKHLVRFTHPFRLISLQDLPEHPEINHVATLRLDMSWLRSTPVYIYQRA